MADEPRKGSPVGAHRHAEPTPFEEAVAAEVKRRAELRRTDPRTIAAEEKLQRDLARIRERKRRRRERGLD